VFACVFNVFGVRWVCCELVVEGFGVIGAGTLFPRIVTVGRLIAACKKGI
jgi:hypothetical protein